MKASHRILLLLALANAVVVACTEQKVDFSADVKPILNKRCISCHGGVKKNGGFSVLFRHEAIDTTESGKPSIVPGHPELSEMIRRINSDDPEYRMPLKEEPLTNAEIEILTRWIEEGANWGDHWAYQPPKPSEIPAETRLLSGFVGGEENWASNEIDQFILAGLERADLRPSPLADKNMLVRRVYLDLIGIPPTPEEAEQFLSDKSDNAYEKLVDKLLASPRYGEKWASWWLDLARYSDTKGYERDVERTIWRYRDWVIKAFNNDMPYDQFTIEQLAGDLLPNPTDDQLIATGFHRNTMNNDEGGTEDEEFRVAALLDRVNTTWEVWQSTTFACIQCHSHPYDPFVHEDYYKSLAFFNNTRDEDVLGEHPNLRIYKEEDQTKLAAVRQWIEENVSVEKGVEVNAFLRTLEPKYHPHDFDQFVNAELIDTKMLGVRAGGSARLKNINLENKKYLLINYSAWSKGGQLEIRLDQLNGEVISKINLNTTKGSDAIFIPLKPTKGKHSLYFLMDNPLLRGTNNPVCSIEWFAFREGLPNGFDITFLELVNADVENTPIMIESNAEQRRKTQLFVRGNWLVKGQEVTPGVPDILNDFPERAPMNRLGFAKWLTSPANPLTARTIVNRVWEQIFGNGIVTTLEDFGSQGEAPSHPELLDWLSLEMMNDYNWSMKRLVKTIVMSSTYRQDSHITPEQLEKDPFNRYLGRAPRVRLSAEQIRDQALCVSGLLSKKMYGPGVMPYQPAGIWNSVWSGAYWKKSHGEDQYRRGIYTFHKRTSPYPSMMMFDGSSREVCLSRRVRTNTPLQALVTLNDSVFFEASVNLAKKIQASAKTPEEQIRAGYSQILFRDISDEKLDVLKKFYDEALATYEKNPVAVLELTKDTSALPHDAAMIMVANAMLNLDEVIMKE
ncbi:MAG TPA: DUF1553 domain-containing protein [Chryseosolibacter sp.]